MKILFFLTLILGGNFYALSNGTIFVKNAALLQKNADIGKIKGVLVLKGIFSEPTYVCVLTYQFQVSIILKSFRQEAILPPTPFPPQNEPLKSPP